MMTEEMKAKKQEYKEAFIAETTDNRSIIEYANALDCVGVLKTPRDHIDEGVNNIIIRIFGINKVGDDFVQHCSLELTLEELLVFRNSINQVLGRI
jgi:hypothetical protein